MIKFSVPIRINVSSKKMIPLNLNHYRNAHFHVLNNAKVNFKKGIHDLFSKGDHDSSFNYLRGKKLKIEYTYFNPTKAKSDISNICSVVDKFLCDALVELGYIDEDNYEVLTHVVFKYGSLDRVNPRVDVCISEDTLEPIKQIKESNMQFTFSAADVLELVEDSIPEIVTNHVQDLIELKANTELDVEVLEDGSAVVKIVKAKKTTTKAKPHQTKSTEKVAEEPVKEKEVETVKDDLPKQDPEPTEEQAKGKAASLFGALDAGDSKEESAPISLFADSAFGD